MITPGSFLDKAIGDKKNEYANTDAKYSHVQDEKRNFIYKKNDGISPRFKFYSSLVKQKNSTEDVVLIGKMISDEIRNYRPIHNDRNIVSNSGNWKTSFLYNLARLLYSMFNGSNYFLSSEDGKSSSPSATLLAIHQPERQDLSQQKSLKYLQKSDTIDGYIKIRKKRGIEDQTTTISQSIIINELLNGVDRKAISPQKISELNDIIYLYENLQIKNSRKGIELLVKQGELLSSLINDSKGNKQLSDNVSKIINLLGIEYQSHKVDIEPFIHAVWVAGAPPENTSSYITAFLKTYKNYTYLLWVDPNAFGAAKFSGILKNIAMNYAIMRLRRTNPHLAEEMKDVILKIQDIQNKKGESNEKRELLKELENKYNQLKNETKERFNVFFLESMIGIQDNYFTYCISNGISSIDDTSRLNFLTTVLRLSPDVQNDFKSSVEKNRRDIESLKDIMSQKFGARFQLRDINTLESFKNPQDYFFYQQEMLLRWNYAAASDQVRMNILKEHGGIYTDTDILPAYSDKLTHIIHKNSDDKRFFEDLKLRRIMSEVILSRIKGEKYSLQHDNVDESTLNQLSNILHEIDGVSIDDYFKPVETTVVRDSFKIFKRYQKWSEKTWNIRGNNNFMLTHKGSKCIDFIQSGQKKQYLELQRIRDNISYNNLFYTTDDLKSLNNMEIGGVPAKKYLEHGLFSEYRQDSIIPYVVSTLNISGPDMIMRQMKKYYKSLGGIGDVHINDNKLSDMNFVGVYTSLDKDNKSFDWLSPVSVGVNDITPDDESSWAIRNNDINKILFEDINCYVPEKLPTAIYYEIDPRVFYQGWDNGSIKCVTDINKDLIKDINLLFTSSDIDVQSVIKIDRELYAIGSKINNPLALRAIRTLQLQLANYVTLNTFEAENTINLIYDFYSKKQGDLLSAIKLFSRNDVGISIIVWYNSIMEKNIFLRDVISCIIWDKKTESHIKEHKGILSREDVRTLRDYAELKMKERFSILDDDGYKKIIATNTYIKERGKLSDIIYDIENSIISGHEAFDIIRTHQHEWGDLSTAEQFKKFEFYVRKELSSFKLIFNSIKNKYITEPEMKRKVLYHQLDGDIQERVSFLDISHYAYPGSLLEKLQLDGYAFSDVNIITEYLLSSYGISGHYSHGVVYPAPSDKLLELLRRHTKSNYDWIERIIPHVYDILSGHDDLSSSLRPPLSEEQKKILSDIKLEINESASEQYFMKLTEQKSSVIGIKYSIDLDKYNDSLFLSLPINKNLIMPFMHRYFELLYDIHIGILKNKINKDFIYAKFSSLNLGFLITDESFIKLESLMKRYKYLSLSEIHKTLTNRSSFADISIPLLSTICPSIATIIKKTEYYGHQLTNAMTVASVVKPYDFSNLGAINSIDKSVSDIPALHTIVEQAKYNLLPWNDFYNTHASMWDTIARQHKSINIEFYPQSLLFDRSSKGKCLGLSLLYLNTGTYASRYQILRHNIETASALYQTKYNDELILSNRDDFFLKKTQHIITMSNELGNNRLHDSRLEILELKDPILTEGILYQRRISSLLITTEYHSLALQQISSFWRVTDPNFGHCDFHSLAQALIFIKNITNNNNFSSLYGDSIVKIYFSESLNNWKDIKLPSIQADSLLREIYITTREKISATGDSLHIGKHFVPLCFIYDIGGVINGNRISDSAVVKNKIKELKINGDILQHYVNTNYLSEEQAQKIKDIVDFFGFQDNTKKVKIESDIKPIADIQQPLHSILSRQKEHVKSLLSGLLDEFSVKLRKQGLSIKSNVLSVNNFKKSKINSDTVEVTVTDLQGRLYNVDIDTKAISLTFKEGLNSLSEAFDYMNIDAIMSVIGLVQYTRIIKMNDNVSAIDHAGAVSDIKNIVDKFLSGVLTLSNNRVYNTGGISGASLEEFISSGLEACASRIGGTAGRYLSNVAKVIKLPLLDIGINIWSLYDSSSKHARATTQLEYISTAIDVSFSSINTALSIAAIAYPPLAIAIVPITIFSHEVKNYAIYVNQINERHKLWREAEKYLDNGSIKVLSINKDAGIIDLSNNQVLGNVYLDMRKNPPLLHGEKSYNSGKNIGSRPDMTDREIMEARAYNFACTKISDAGVPDIFGWEDKDICNSMKLSESQLAHGYSNRQWPSQIPVIPEGSYNTIYLGYGETLRANTEVTFSDSGYFYEIARAYTDDEPSEPLLTICNQHSHVIGGKEPLTIIIPAIENGMLGSNLHMIERFKNYNFSISGGGGGLKLLVGGIGDYNIECAPGVRNTISFEQLSRDFNLELDLSDERIQYFNFHHPAGFYSGKVMSITQKGINSVIGTKLGYDKIRGNDLDNAFILGGGGGVIYSGGGSNTYFIPDVLQDNLHIYISERSSKNHIILGDKHSNLSFECYFSDDKREFIKIDSYNGGDIVLESETTQKIKNFASNVTIQTADGVMANWDNELNTLSISSIDMIAWWTQNKTEKEPLPMDVIHLTNWRVHNLCSLFYDKYQVDIERNKLTYTVLSPDSELPIQLKYASVIYGSHGVTYSFLGAGSEYIDIYIVDESKNPDSFDFRNIIFEHQVNDIFISFDNQGGFIISIFNNSTSEVLKINVYRKDMASLEYCRSLIYLPGGDVFHISDIYKISKGRERFKLNIEKKPVIDDVIDVGFLESSYVHIKKMSSNNNDGYVLCLDNPNASSYSLNFNELSGYVSGIWDNFRGGFTPFYNNTLNFTPHEKKYIYLSRLDKLSFKVDAFRQPLEIKDKNGCKLSKFTWETYGDIIISPEDRVYHLELDGFNYFVQPDLKAPISDSFSYLYNSFKIVDGDVHLKLLHINKETKQVTPHRIILQRYFIDSFVKISIDDRERHIYPVITDSPDHFTNDIYRYPFRIILGNKIIYPSEELVKFIKTSRVYLSNMDITNNVIIPQKTRKRNELSIVSLNSNVRNDIILSGVVTGTLKVFHLNDSGDLLLTTSKTHGGGIVIIFEDFINNWWKYNITLITVPIDEKLSDNRISITPMGININETLNGKDKLFFYPTPLKTGCFILHDPFHSGSFSSLYSHELFDLVEMHRNPAYSYSRNSIVNRYIHTVSGHKKKDDITNISLSIYAFSTCSFWSKNSVEIGDIINLSDYKHVEFSFNSFNDVFFREQNSNTYKIFFKIAFLNSSIITDENMLSQKSFLGHNAFFSIIGIDESLYDKHIIFITLKAVEPPKSGADCLYAKTADHRECDTQDERPR